MTVPRVGGCILLAAFALVLARSGLVYRFDPTAPPATRYAVTPSRPARAAG